MNKKELLEEIEKKCLKDCVWYGKCISCLEACEGDDKAVIYQEYSTRCREQWK